MDDPFYYRETTSHFIIGDPMGNTMAYIPKYVKNSRKESMQNIAHQIVTALNTTYHMQKVFEAIGDKSYVR